MLEQSLSYSPTFWASLYSWFTPTIFFLLLQLVIATIYITSSLANATHKPQHHQDPNFPQPHHQNHLLRSPSVLQRLKSINFYSYQQPYSSQQHEEQQPQQNETHVPQQLARSPSVLQRLKSINLYSYLPTQNFTSKISLENRVKKTEEQEQEHEQDDVLGKIRNNNLGGNEEEYDNVSLEEVFMKLQGQGGNFARTHSDTKPDSGEVPVKLSRKMKKSASSKSAFSNFKEEDIVESRRPATVKETKVAAAVDEDELVDSKADDFINKFKQQLKLQRIDSIMRYKDMINKKISK